MIEVIGLIAVGFILGAVAGYRFTASLYEKLTIRYSGGTPNIKPGAITRSMTGRRKKAVYVPRMTDDEASKQDKNSLKRLEDELVPAPDEE